MIWNNESNVRDNNHVWNSLQVWLVPATCTHRDTHIKQYAHIYIPVNKYFYDMICPQLEHGMSSETQRWVGCQIMMACCLTAPGRYLNSCWLIMSEGLWHSLGPISQKMLKTSTLGIRKKIKITATSPRGNELNKRALSNLTADDFRPSTIHWSLFWRIQMKIC